MDNKPQAPDAKRRRPAAIVIVLNLLLMLVVAAALGWLVMSWLGYWTNHGKTAVVPAVRGLPYEAALASIQEAGMVCEVSDSVYDSKAKPGTVMEQNPKAANIVKPGRTIYLTVNAFYPRKVSVPQLTDISLRQARSILEGLGITDIVEKKVISEYRDLVLGAECNGVPLTAGMRVPVTARVVLFVGDGLFEEEDTTAGADITELTTDY